MALYIVVHHRRDQNQPWSNAWNDDEQLKAITTTTEIGRLCENTRRQNGRVHVHRCGWNGHEPTISCSLRVQSVETIDRNTSLVKFSDLQVLNSQPPLQPVQGQNYYIY